MRIDNNLNTMLATQLQVSDIASMAYKCLNASIDGSDS